jgi:hypothetical protein
VRCNGHHHWHWRSIVVIDGADGAVQLRVDRADVGIGQGDREGFTWLKVIVALEQEANLGAALLCFNDYRTGE